ncbi:MAG: RNA polymerase factor sigma-54 [Flavobacteriaceae bacterium]|jgi:RNA polymerase sigma-54 factor|nr:RNA polymerase factor sigma-54 [Flavobacteriaceae bacterium]MDP4675272.1 RNA polymerase factor sigma-54 [Flavobacteriaceae bacterium]MDP4754778.1 RNA polymerase factor sigma-54 [Flavobacteriaceae bacterium]MDP4794910.1 RNA polymerase factor sigma-54 [Flavobacteriaceae bacterium]MDP4884811.1 RNA polymerase factor sigma-54 [Flavobacteriaceae bacterium]
MLKQHLQLKLAQKLSPQQIQLMKLIQLPTQAFEQRIRQELEENPALEKGKEALESDVNDDFEDDLYDNDSQEIDAQDVNIDDYLSDDEIPDYKTQSNNYAEQEEREIPYAAGQSFYQSLIDQLNQQMTTEREWLIGAFLIGSIDESGYLRRPMLDLLDDLAFNENLIASEQEVAQVIIQHLHKLDPAGVGARTLEECLLIQLSRKTPTEAVKNAVLLLTEAFDAFTKKHYDKIMTRLKWHEETLRDALNEIEKLNPKPGSAFTEQGKITEHIIPDFTLLVQDGSIDIQLNGRNAPELHVSQTYQTLMHTYKDGADKTPSLKEAVTFIKHKLDAAQWFIDAIKQRQDTLIKTMSAIVAHQKEYFLTGDETKIKPLILKDIAQEIQMDISTVSRVVNSKYVDTPYGTHLVKYYFSEGMKNEQGEDISTKEIKTILAHIIESEDKSAPLNDDQLTSILKEKGYPIARRTVAKYREQLGLPVARLRKAL